MVILLTATIDPSGMINTALQEKRIRKKQYLEAIDFYLEKTDCNIVFCENSGYNIFEEIKSLKKFERVEYFTFYGNSYNKEYGKSYGEINIIKYALDNSIFIKKDNLIIKITGRVKILNIKELIKKYKKQNCNKPIIACELLNLKWMMTICFLISKDLLYVLINNIIQYYHKLPTEISIEKILLEEILLLKNITIRSFLPIIDGIKGFNNTPYINNPKFLRNLNHFNTLRIINKRKKFKREFVKSTICWIYNLFIYQLYKLKK